MQEIVKLVTDKTGLPEAQAKQAVEVVLTFLKAKLPGPIASQIDSVIAGGALPKLGDIAGDLGGLFGKK